MSQLADSQYDIALLMNADNVVEKNFLNEINNTYASGSNAIQSHRIHKDRPNNIIVLDAVADEINNSILRAVMSPSGYPPHSMAPEQPLTSTGLKKTSES